MQRPRVHAWCVACSLHARAHTWWHHLFCNRASMRSTRLLHAGGGGEAAGGFGNGGGGGGGEPTVPGGEGAIRDPQSSQSVPKAHALYCGAQRGE